MNISVQLKLVTFFIKWQTQHIALILLGSSQLTLQNKIRKLLSETKLIDCLKVFILFLVKF